MQHILFAIILILFESLLLWMGAIISRKLLGTVPLLFSVIGAFLIGHGVGIPIAYILSCLFTGTHEPVLWAVVTEIVLLAMAGFCETVRELKKKKISKKDNASISLSDIGVALFSVVFSTWLMVKTFHGTGGQLFVGSNNVFDFGMMVGLVRSISWGTNIPFGSPFFAGLPFLYHFLFVFWTAIWEYFGAPTVWAVNIPSILSFSAFLIVVYYLPQIVLRQKKIVGWVAVFLTITNSSLAFWYIILQKGLSIGMLRSLWRLPSYPFAGPFDGSTISIFITLNNYVNQRQLAFGIALGLFLFILAAKWSEEKRMNIQRSAVLGLLTGGLWLWNMAVCVIISLVIAFLLLFQKNRKVLVVFLATTGIIVFVSLMQFIPFLAQLALFLHNTSGPVGTASIPHWGLGEYLWENLGFLPFVAALGFVVISKKQRAVWLPFVLLFLAVCLLADLWKRGFDQKFLSILIVGVNVLGAVGLSYLWKTKRVLIKGFSFVLFCSLIVSGIIDLVPIKNEFAYPLIGQDTIHLVSWIRDNTPKSAVFVSYADMIDPVVLAGRTNYFGFFGNVGWYDRSPIVQQMYNGDLKVLKANTISYILIPKWSKNDFPYVINKQTLLTISQIVYEDSKFMIFRVKS